MSRSHFQDFNRDDGTPITAYYHYTDAGTCPEITAAWRRADEHMADAPEIELTTSERERMEAWIGEHRYWDDHRED